MSYYVGLKNQKNEKKFFKFKDLNNALNFIKQQKNEVKSYAMLII
jgi:hypothetical protein